MELSFHVYIFPLELAICSTNRYNKYNTKYNKNPTFFGQKPNYLYHGNSNISSKIFFGISDLW